MLDETDSSIIRVLVRTTDGDTSPSLARGFETNWSSDPSAATSTKLEFSEIARLESFLDAVRSGYVDFPLIREAAPLLSKLLGNPPSSLDGTVEIRTDGTTFPITDLPWEAAGRASQPLPQENAGLLDALLGSLPIYRSVPKVKELTGDSRYRPRVLLVISNPFGINAGQIDEARVRRSCENVFASYPVFETMVLGDRQPWEVLGQKILHFDPHIFLYVGHGSSDPKNEHPSLAFTKVADTGAVNWVAAADVAAAVTQGGSCRLAILAACDLVRQSPASAAVGVIESGIDEVVAMQGSVFQNIAEKLLYFLLSGVLDGRTLPENLAMARYQIRESPHCILPVAFRGTGMDLRRLGLRSYGARYAEALQALARSIPTLADIYPRENIVDSISGIFVASRATESVAIVCGEPGNGVTTCLRIAIASFLAETKNRPIVYIDCEPRRRSLALTDWLRSQLLFALHSNSVLRPKSAPSFAPLFRDEGETAQWTGELAVRARVSVVLDNLSESMTDGEIQFLSRLARCFQNNGRQAKLILAGHSRALRVIDHFTRLEVPALTERETNEFGELFLKEVDRPGLFERTRGNLLLLDTERGVTKTDTSADFPVPQGANVFDLYVAQLGQRLSSDARSVVIRMALFDIPLAQSIVQDQVAPDQPGALEELIRAHVIEHAEDDGQRVLYMPLQRATEVRTKWRDQIDPSEKALVERFLALFEEGDAALHNTARLLGGENYFAVVQTLAMKYESAFDQALGLPIFLEGHLNARTVLRMYARSIGQIGEADAPQRKGLDESVAAEIRLRGARCALNLGDSNLAMQWCEQVPQLTDPVLECKRLLLKALLLKDRAQGTSLPEIMGMLRDAQGLTKNLSPEEEESRREIEQERIEVVLDAVPTVLFLEHRTAEEALNLVSPFLSELSDLDKAQLYATLAERAMKSPIAEVNWSQVAEWVTSSQQLLSSRADDRTRTYCTYQQAQFFRKRPEPRLTEAYKLYETARAAAAKVDEARREALAFYRVIELERDHEGLRADVSDWPRQRLEEVNDLSPRLEEENGEALSMRALGRLLATAGSVAADAEVKRDYLAKAAGALSADVLKSASDQELFATVCLARLNLDLEDPAGYQDALGFLLAYKSQIQQRFRLPVDINDPGGCKNGIESWLTAAHGVQAEDQ